jgi:hypothetical protein
VLPAVTTTEGMVASLRRAHQRDGING